MGKKFSLILIYKRNSFMRNMKISSQIIKTQYSVYLKILFFQGRYIIKFDSIWESGPS